MMQRKHPSEAMTGATGALPGEAIRVLIQIVALHPEAKRKDHQVLIDKGWLTADESERFYKTAGYYRHGYPKTPIKHASPMEYIEASILIKKLFWQLVDAIEPT